MRIVRVVLALSIACGLLVAVGFVPRPALAVSIMVGPNCIPDNIQAAVDNLPSEGGTITFACGSSTLYFNASEAITIDKPVVIDGNNAFYDETMIFEGTNQTNFFVVGASGDLTLMDLTLQNGKANQGGAISNAAGGSLTVRDSVFRGNVAGFVGGAISNENGGRLSISDSVFEGNMAFGGGAIETFGNGIVSISDSTFISNNTTGGGGALVIGMSTVDIVRSTFIENQTGGLGGAINNVQDSTLTIDQSAFVRNKTTGSNRDGGAIYSYLRCVLEVSRSSFVGNEATSDGGAIYDRGNRTQINASTFSDNRAGERGSVIDVVASEYEQVTEISWSTIIQPSNTASALTTEREVTLTGVMLGGEGTLCEIDGGTLIDSYSLAADESCGLTGTGSAQGVDDLGLGSAIDVEINGVVQTYYPLVPGSPAVDGGSEGCDTAVQEGRDTDQIGNARPFNGYCDTGAVESLYQAEVFCANDWNGQLRQAMHCGRSETRYKFPQTYSLRLCVNGWNGAVRVDGDGCGRSEERVLALGDGTLSICVNNWNGAIRVDDRCRRSEQHQWL